MSRIDLGKTQRDDGQIVAAQPQRREGDDEPDDRADGQRGAPADQDRHAGAGRNRRRIGADREEAGEAEIDQPGQPQIRLRPSASSA